MNLNRYSRQTVFPPIGVEGQQKLFDARVAIIGVGALGTVIANNLCRSGVGFLRIIDRDYVEWSNLQRQTLYQEQDAAEQLPKAVAAYQHLSKVNSEIVIEPVVDDVNSSNIENLIKDVDLVLDGSDNLEVRFLINEACHKYKIPWIYGGAIGSTGMTMNIIPGEGPCFRCLCPSDSEAGSTETCSTAGVLNMLTGVIASIESAEAIKILIGSPDVRKDVFFIDLWDFSTQVIEIPKDKDCPTCARSHYEYLSQTKGSYSTSLCGRDSIQIVPGSPTNIDFEYISGKLKKVGTVKYNRFMLSFDDGTRSFNLFPDGRAIIKNVKDEFAAKSVYSEYIGL